MYSLTRCVDLALPRGAPKMSDGCDSSLLLGGLAWVTDGRVLPLVVMSAALTSSLAARVARQGLPGMPARELDATVDRTRAGFVHDVFKNTLPQTATSGDACKQCTGKGRSPCGECYTSRAQPVGLLPKGQFPSWCMACKARETVLCSRCLGTGKRPSIGFR